MGWLGGGLKRRRLSRRERRDFSRGLSCNRKHHALKEEEKGQYRQEQEHEGTVAMISSPSACFVETRYPLNAGLL